MSLYRLIFLVLIILICLSISANQNYSDIKKKKVESFCVRALEFYLDRPDLETEFLRR